MMNFILSRGCQVVFGVILLNALAANADYLDEWRHVPVQNRSFIIDGKVNVFMLNGKSFRYISGSVHYFRIHPDYWYDRLLKIKQSGCNAVQTPVEWSLHQPNFMKFNFSGGRDLFNFIDVAEKVGLFVVLNLGPYIDADRDLGGLPHWLKTLNSTVKLRTSDPNFISYVDQWYEYLLPRLVNKLYINGGNILLMQVEHEYGSHHIIDQKYKIHLRDTIRKHIGQKPFLFTSDICTENALRRGKIEDIFATVTYGVEENMKTCFSYQRKMEPEGPFVNSKFVIGKFTACNSDFWSNHRTPISVKKTIKQFDRMLKMAANVNLYMMHGGTSFGLTTAPETTLFAPGVTSYDYHAPITEAGDLTPEYFAIHKVIYNHVPNIRPLNASEVNVTVEKAAYGRITMTPLMTLNDSLPYLASRTILHNKPLTFEELDFKGGLVIYETRIKELLPDPAMLTADISDRAYVYVDGDFRGMMSRMFNVLTIGININPGQLLTIIVECQGRPSVGNLDFSVGLIPPVKFHGHEIPNKWVITPVNLDSERNLERFVHKAYNNLGHENSFDPVLTRFNERSMAFWKGTLTLPCHKEPKDTFISFPSFQKGVFFVNGFIVGKYWPRVGPQHTLYLPAPILKGNCTENIFMLLENDSQCLNQEKGCYIISQNYHILDGKTPDFM